MPKRRIFTIGFELPGDDFEYVPFDSDQSLLDTDIVLFEVGFGDHYPTGSYQGERLFDHQDSVRVAQNLQHWRAELAAATNAGKLVIVFLVKPLSYFRYTGEQQISGTGRSRVRTDIVSRVESYEAVPYVVSAEAKSGREVQLTKDATYLAPYWNFSSILHTKPLLTGNLLIRYSLQRRRTRRLVLQYRGSTMKKSSPKKMKRKKR